MQIITLRGDPQIYMRKCSRHIWCCSENYACKWNTLVLNVLQREVARLARKQIRSCSVFTSTKLSSSSL